MSVQAPQPMLVGTVASLRSIILELQSPALPRNGNSGETPLLGDCVDCVLTDLLVPALERLNGFAALDAETGQPAQ